MKIFLARGTIFPWCWEDPEPDPYLCLPDPDADPDTQHCCKGCDECKGNGDGHCGDVAVGCGDVAGDWGDDCGERDAYRTWTPYSTVFCVHIHCCASQKNLNLYLQFTRFRQKKEEKTSKFLYFLWSTSILMTNPHTRNKKTWPLFTSYRQNYYVRYYYTLKEENCYVIIVRNYGTVQRRLTCREDIF
jgi:hypothetical protein